ncbi:hypothetical protein [Microscilla marina]|uniref:Transposase IS4-like domain-containing protein n=1 Tax=Microscilla marina ATCC 23134 TaxID=313606 RepID=A1ZR25_MICM2|nr:hypothetical protein [Microscilla marina]EAY25428.1 hypothetical protein M23134_06687 [Microscilla marina ATCC 23134]EAY27114.1 hypothetical protein M23134_08388 [Microscilla marina ATCC 23134]
MVLQVKRWLPDKDIIVVGDNSYASIEFLDKARKLATIIATMRMDTALYDFVLRGREGVVG